MRVFPGDHRPEQNLINRKNENENWKPNFACDRDHHAHGSQFAFGWVGVDIILSFPKAHDFIIISVCHRWVVVFIKLSGFTWANKERTKRWCLRFGYIRRRLTHSGIKFLGSKNNKCEIVRWLYRLVKFGVALSLFKISCGRYEGRYKVSWRGVKEKGSTCYIH